MPILTLDITGTPAATGIGLRRLFLSPISCATYLIALSACAFIVEETGDTEWLFVVTGILLFSLWIIHCFIREVLITAPVLPNNPATLLDSEIIARCTKSAITSRDLLSAALKTERGKLFLKLLGTTQDVLTAACGDVIDALPVAEFIRGAKDIGADLGENRISATSLLTVLLHLEGVPRIFLNTLDLSTADVTSIAFWESLQEELIRRPKVFSPSWLLETCGAMARTSLAGYTTTLDLFTRDITASLAGTDAPRVTLHEKEAQTVLEMLSRPSGHHVLLVGDEGIGKRTFIKNIARRIHSHELKKSKAFTRVLFLDAELLVSGTKQPDAVLLHALDSTSRREQFLFVLSDVGLLLKTADEKFTAVLTRLLSFQNIRVIGIATNADYHGLIRERPALDKQWSVVELAESDPTETMATVLEHVVRSRTWKKTELTYKALQSVVTLSTRYFSKGAQPGKAVRIFDDAVLHARRSGDRVLTEEHIREAIASIVPVDLISPTSRAARAVASLGDSLAHDIVGQTEAVNAVAQSLKRARADVGTGKGPLAAFLFVGPTGVGKTELAKAVARNLFKNEDALVRLNMNDYGSPESATLIVGGEGSQEGYVLKRVQDHPFCVMLLDEIEKADRSVQHLFLQALDEGMLIDANGRRTDFRNAVIIATSNAAAPAIAEAAKEGKSADPRAWRTKVLDCLSNEHAFSPEFLNRFTDVIAFTPLSLEEATEIAKRLIQGIKVTLEATRGINVVISDAAMARVIERGFSVTFGAREMKRAVTDVVENAVAEALLKGMKRGEEIRID